MPKLSIGTGVALVLVGVIGYVVSGMASWTALIPAILGVPFVVLGLIALKPGARKHAMHAAAAWALLGVGGTIGGVMKMIQWGFGTEPARPAAVVAQSVTAVLCVLFLAFAIRSFVAARRARVNAPGFGVAGTP